MELNAPDGGSSPVTGAIRPDDRGGAAPAGGAAGAGARVLAAIGGVVVLLAGALMTLGLALAALVGVLAAGWWARRRGRSSATLVEGWIGATSAGTMLVAAIMVGLAVAAPRGTFRDFQAQAVANAKKPAPPPPAWLDRMTRMTPRNDAADRASQRLATSSAFVWYIVAFSMALMCLLFGTVAGTLAWGGALLLRFAIRGAWRAPPPAAAAA